MTEREALKLALEALEDRVSLMKWQLARDVVKEALAQPEHKPLTDEMRKQMKERCDSMEMRGAFADGWMSSEAAHGIKEKNT